MAKKILLELKNIIPRFTDIAFKEPINWTTEEDQHWAVIGANGSGKTILTDIITGKYALKSGEIFTDNAENKSQYIKSVSFRDIYSLSDVQNSYYQQRWNAGTENNAPIAKDLLLKFENKEWLNFLIDSFHTEDLLDKEINLLSSGELRKFLIIRSLLSKPRILILDNPFIGLDAKSRVILNDVLRKLADLEHLQIILVLSNPDDIPEMITHVLPIKDKEILEPRIRDNFLNDKNLYRELFYQTPAKDLSESIKKDTDFENALIFKNIHIKYGKRTILKDLNWTVKRGEKWALLGENGSGKSTLLSLVCGDNPQAYANDITLFDRKRGTGESIWDIKKHIGYISPEMHLYYQKNIRCLDIVGSGFFDTIGLYRKCNEEQEKIALEWMKIFNVSHLKDSPFLQASSGEQRLVLLARIFVKNPDLLILDEPLHGLDITNKKRVKAIIEEFCDSNKALIYVTHYENEIPNVVDKRLVLQKN